MAVAAFLSVAQPSVKFRKAYHQKVGHQMVGLPPVLLLIHGMTYDQWKTSELKYCAETTELAFEEIITYTFHIANL